MGTNVTLTTVGWLLVIAALYAWSKSRAGHTIIYMALSLILLLLVLTNYSLISSVVFKKESGG